MKTLTTKTLKVLVEQESLSASNLIELEEWENEGGSHSKNAELLKSLAPVRKGDILDVKSTNLYVQGEKLVLEIEVEVLAHAR